MKTRKLPQDGVVFEVIENFQEIIWNKISLSVKRFMKNQPWISRAEAQGSLLDKVLWKSIRTTNILERTLREMRCRTRPMNNFLNN